MSIKKLRGKGKTVYITAADKEVWDEANLLLRAKGESTSQMLARLLSLSLDSYKAAAMGTEVKPPSEFKPQLVRNGQLAPVRVDPRGPWKSVIDIDKEPA